jgi:hypothetical protein
MDLVRLVLERAKTAGEARVVLIDLLERAYQNELLDQADGCGRSDGDHHGESVGRDGDRNDEMRGERLGGGCGDGGSGALRYHNAWLVGDRGGGGFVVESVRGLWLSAAVPAPVTAISNAYSLARNVRCSRSLQLPPPHTDTDCLLVHSGTRAARVCTTWRSVTATARREPQAPSTLRNASPIHCTPRLRVAKLGNVACLSCLAPRTLRAKH